MLIICHNLKQVSHSEESSLPGYQENDSKRFPSDGKYKKGDGRAEGYEGAAKEHRSRHSNSSCPKTATLKTFVVSSNFNENVFV